MKVTINKNNLQKALGFVEHVTSKNAALPILSNVLLKTEHGRLKISATNLEIGVSSTIGAKVDAEGSIAVPGRILLDFVRAVQGDVISLSLTQHVLSVDGGTYQTSILCFDPSEYPIIPNIETEHTYSLPVPALRKMLMVVNSSMATSESRPELAGSLLTFKDGAAIAAATDGFRLAEYTMALVGSREASIIVPRGTVTELLRVLGDIQGDILLRITDNQVAFTHDGVEIITRLIDGNYPDYRKVIPERSLSKILVRKNELENAIKIAALFSSSISDIQLSCQENQLTISAKNATKGEARASIEANTKGDPFEIAVNYHYFLDGLAVIDTDKIVIEFTGTGSPFVLRPNDDKKEVVYLIMPLRH